MASTSRRRCSAAISYKSQEKAMKNKKAGQTAAKPGRPIAVAPLGAAPSPLSNGFIGVALQVKVIKSLVEQIGVEQGASLGSSRSGHNEQGPGALRRVRVLLSSIGRS